MLHHFRPVVPGGATASPDQLTLSQQGGADYAHHITTDTPGFSDLPTALHLHYAMYVHNVALRKSIRQTSMNDVASACQGMNECM
jgi:hypothetical protein